MNRRSFLKSLLGVLASTAVPASALKVGETFVSPVGAVETPEALEVASIADSKWHHIAFTRASGAIQLFCDGERVSDIEGVRVDLTESRLSLVTDELKPPMVSFNVVNSKLPVTSAFGRGPAFDVPNDAALDLSGDFTVETWIKIPENDVPNAAHIDDLRISSIARDPDQFPKKAPDGKGFLFAQDPSPSSPDFYFKSIEVIDHATSPEGNTEILSMFKSQVSKHG